RAYQTDLERYRQDRERAEAAEREGERLEEAVRAAWAAVTEAEGRAARARDDLPDDLSEVESRREEARERLRGLEEEAERAAAQQAERSEALERVRVQVARRETALEQASDQLASFPDGLEPVPLNDRAARSELRDAERALDAIGAVNHRAAQVLAELEGEHARRAEEVSGARDAVERLYATLERLDRETTERLTAAIHALRDRFRAHVHELFGPEGEGDVVADLDAHRPVGLRIRLQPPGKRTQALGLLSVGERTMGALAFLFALMSEESGGAGLPVAVLDEVDAPLDEANIRRYRGFLERWAARGTQFVLITHQKATFEVADVLWGVTTEGGVSRVFSIRKEDDEPRALASAGAP
ncbi:MAG: hypothetical protein WD336_02230, partial [Trueperaceae bacterium]